MNILEDGERKSTQCPQCGDVFEAIGSHWSQSYDCDYPEYTDRQRELAKGLTMGDGSLSTTGKSRKAHMVVMSVQTRFLSWIDEQFGALSAGVRLHQTGEEIQSNAADTGFGSPNDPWEYHDVYTVHLRNHPTLAEMNGRWYPNGTICYPDSLSLTPEAARMWYCSDGGLSWSGKPYVTIGTHNEADRPEFLCDLFRQHGFDPVWSEPLIRFTNDEAADVLEWLGDPVPGYEYKWVCESRSDYDRVKSEVGQ